MNTFESGLTIYVSGFPKQSSAQDLQEYFAKHLPMFILKKTKSKGKGKHQFVILTGITRAEYNWLLRSEFYFQERRLTLKGFKAHKTTKLVPLSYDQTYLMQIISFRMSHIDTSFIQELRRFTKEGGDYASICWGVDVELSVFILRIEAHLLRIRQQSFLTKVTELVALFRSLDVSIIDCQEAEVTEGAASRIGCSINVDSFPGRVSRDLLCLDFSNDLIPLPFLNVFSESVQIRYPPVCRNWMDGSVEHRENIRRIFVTEVGLCIKDRVCTEIRLNKIDQISSRQLPTFENSRTRMADSDFFL